MKFHLGLGIIFVLAATSLAVADDGGAANALVVDSVKKMQTAKKARKASERLRLMEGALCNLNRIVDQYPKTDIAARLVTGEQVGEMTVDGLQKDIIELRGLIGSSRNSNCWTTPTYQCVIDLAVDITNKTADTFFRSDFFADLAMAQATAGDVDGAVASLRETAEHQYLERAKVYREIAKFQTANGEIEAGLEALKGIERAFAAEQELLGMIDVARVLNERGYGGAGLKIFNMVDRVLFRLPDDHPARIVLMAALVMAEAEMVGRDAAKERLPQLRTWMDNHFTQNASLLILQDVSVAFAVAGDLDTAVHLADRAEAEQPRGRSGLIATIGEALAVSGDVDASQGLLEQIFDLDDKERVLLALVSALVERGDVAGAIGFTKKIFSRDMRARALGIVATARLNSGDGEAAGRAMALLKEETAAKFAIMRIPARIALAGTLVEIQQYRQARTAIRQAISDIKEVHEFTQKNRSGSGLPPITADYMLQTLPVLRKLTPSETEFTLNCPN